MTGEGRAPCEVLKVAGASKPVSVAGAIAGVIRSQLRVEVHPSRVVTSRPPALT